MGYRPLILILGLTLAPAAAQVFSDVTAGSGLSVAPVSDPLGRGFACADFTGDLLPDVIFFPPAGGIPNHFVNQGGGTFVDQGGTSGLAPAFAYVRGLCPADFDGDGDQDLFVCLQLEPSRLYVNDGTGNFTEESASRGITHGMHSWSASFGDYDRDGHLDLYVGRAGFGPGEAVNRLYRNDGTGNFLDVTASSGTGDAGLAFTVAFCDADEDGWPDLHVINDKGYAVSPNVVLRNLGDGTFVDVAPAWGLDLAVDAMGVDFLDLFADGGQDFVIADNPPDHHLLVRAPGALTWTDRTAALGVAGGHAGWCPLFIDVDCDARPDLHVVHSNGPNALFMHSGGTPTGPAFVDAALALGLAHDYRHYASAILDFDADGRLDLLHLMQQGGTSPPATLILQRNQVAAGNHLRIRLEGTRSNRDGLGAKVVVSAGGITQRQWHRSGRGYLAASEPILHFGLGAASHADVTILWPSGQEQRIPNVSANTTLLAVEPRLELDAIPSVGSTLGLVASSPGDPTLPVFIGLSLATSPGLPLPDGRWLELAPDPLLQLSLLGQNPILPSFGLLDSAGQATLPLWIPPLPALSGVQFHAAGATLDFLASAGVRNLFRPLDVVIP